MNKDTEMRIAALFDGDEILPGKQDLLDEIERDPEARAYWNQLEALSSGMDHAHVSSSGGDHHWEVVRSRINGNESTTGNRVLRFPKYAAAMAAILVLGMGIWLPLRNNTVQPGFSQLDSAVYMVETELENATPIVYIDEPSGWTVVWVVEQDVADKGHG